MNERDAWDMYFAGIASIRLHPANDQHHEHNQLHFAAKCADEMLAIRRSRWHGWEPSSQEQCPTSDKAKQTIKT